MDKISEIRERWAKATIGEVWKPIPGLEGKYEASNMGNVRSYYKNGNKGYNFSPHPRIMKGGINKAGYKTVCLIMEDGQPKTKRIHSIIANTFLPNKPSDLHEISHINGDKLDNRADNLAWETHAENEARKREHGTSPIGENCGTHKLLNWQVEAIKYLLYKGIPQAKLAVLFDVKRDAISLIAKGKTWTHIQAPTDIAYLLGEVDRLQKQCAHMANCDNCNAAFCDKQNTPMIDCLKQNKKYWQWEGEETP